MLCKRSLGSFRAAVQGVIPVSQRTPQAPSGLCNLPKGAKLGLKPGSLWYQNSSAMLPLGSFRDYVYLNWFTAFPSVGLLLGSQNALSAVFWCSHSRQVAVSRICSFQAIQVLLQFWSVPDFILLSRCLLPCSQFVLSDSNNKNIVSVAIL